MKYNFYLRIIIILRTFLNYKTLTVKKVIRKTLKVLAWIIGIVIFLLVLIYVLIQVPAVQNFARKKVVSYLENKIHTRVQIGKLSLAFPKRIVL